MLLGDANCDNVVNFLDIAPFVALLVQGDFKAQADIDLSGEVDFVDIALLVDILTNEGTVADPLLIAHRGQPLLYPESSWGASLLSAQSQRAVEFDVRILADGTLVNFHDETLDRITTRTGRLSNITTFAQFEALQHSSPNNTRIPNGSRFHSIEEAIDYLTGDAILFFETKENATVAPLLALLESKNVDKSRIVMTSFTLGHLPVFVDAGYGTMWVCNGLSPDVQKAKDIGICGVFIRQDLSDDVFERWLDAGFVVHAYTLNNTANYQRLLDLGVTGFYSDNISVLE